MTNDIKISRELATEILKILLLDEWEQAIKLAEILNAPAVESQDPVAVVLPERKQYPGIGTYPDAVEYAAACNEVSTWNACLDKVKELNQ